MSYDPSRSEVNMIHAPSRENDALPSKPACGSSGFALLPSASARKISALIGPKLANAISYCGAELATSMRVQNRAHATVSETMGLWFIGVRALLKVRRPKRSYQESGYVLLWEDDRAERC